ncbi:hypothetical protein B0T10DRAFT_557116 [Thelonectria olida]|uniref:Uncharacterized protein n=1 Tax=Thelonectria olida TaxID=1576542 RepID=A0A9P9AVM1_9HYPO|nr:hypothetical protein B0T10DRAFT_557116 [Thelonectria olida]
MDHLQSVLFCCPSQDDAPQRAVEYHEKQEIITDQPVPYSDDAADQFIEILRTAHKCGPELQDRLNQVVSTTGWSDKLAEQILKGITKVVEEGKKMDSAMSEAMEKAVALAQEFAIEHPYYTALIAAGTLIAVAILAMMAPGWIMEALGFALKGPRSRSFAARWMSEIARKYGNVSKGSLYAYLQRMGMILKK